MKTFHFIFTVNISDVAYPYPVANGECPAIRRQCDGVGIASYHAVLKLTSLRLSSWNSIAWDFSFPFSAALVVVAVLILISGVGDVIAKDVWFEVYYCHNRYNRQSPTYTIGLGSMSFSFSPMDS